MQGCKNTAMQESFTRLCPAFQAEPQWNLTCGLDGAKLLGGGGGAEKLQISLSLFPETDFTYFLLAFDVVAGQSFPSQSFPS